MRSTLSIALGAAFGLSSQAVAADEVVLLDDGDSPRRVLEYSLRSGEEAAAHVDMAMGMTMSMGGMQAMDLNLPTMRYVVSSDVGRCKKKKGWCEIEQTLSGGTLTGAVAPEMEGALREAVSGLDGTRIVQRIYRNGRSELVEVVTPEAMPADTAEQLDQATEAASRAVVPLPSEPVGIGGRWQATQRVSQRGMEIDQTAVYEVLGLSDSHALLDVTIEQQLVSVSNVAGLGDEAGVTLGNFESRGTGRNTLNLARPLASEADVDLDLDMSLSVEKGGVSFDMDMSMGIEVSVTPLDAR